jgi:hypothetical protein
MYFSPIYDHFLHYETKLRNVKKLVKVCTANISLILIFTVY